MSRSDVASTEIQEEHPQSTPPEGDSKAPASEAVLNYLRRAISENPAFPAFAANVQELLAIKENPYNTVHSVSQIILRDLSLTTQILKLVNSIFFQTYQRQVHTISNAVMILGFDRIRDLAIGLRLFENFKGSQSFTHLKQLIVLSFLTAMQAQELAGQDARLKPEEVFITALFFNIGELITAFYFPEQYKKIQMLTTAKGLNKRAAAQQVLKVAMDDLGLAVLQDWNIPESMVRSLTVMHGSDDDASQGESHLRKVVKSAYTLSKNAMNPEIDPEVRRQQRQRVCRVLNMKPSALAQSLAASKDRLQEMAHVLKMDMRKIDLTGAIPPQGRQEEALPKTAAREKESLAAPPEEARKAAPSPKAGEEAAPSPKAGPDAVSPKVGAEEAEDFKRLQFLYQVLEEVNQAIVSKVPINQILLMVLEGIFRGISFDRVIFSLVNVKRTHIGARFGLGEGIEELLPLMRAPLQSKTHALSLALAEDQDYMIDLEAQPQDRLLMEEEFWRASGVRSFLISPILVDQKAIGSVYVDRRHSRLPITETDRLRMRIFRDQLIIAIRLSSSQI